MSRCACHRDSELEEMKADVFQMFEKRHHETGNEEDLASGEKFNNLSVSQSDAIWN